MSGVEALARAYERSVRQSWEGVAGPQRVWFAIYRPEDERRLRARIGEFENITRQAGHGWRHCDLTDCFAAWMASHPYRDRYFARPDDIQLALEGFTEQAVETVRAALAATNVDPGTVVAVSGVAALFGLTRLSAVVDGVAREIPGRLLVFFPGHRDGANYRLLDARDGWNDLAMPIVAGEG